MISTGISLCPSLSPCDHLQISWALKFGLDDKFSLTSSQSVAVLLLRNYIPCKLIFWPILVPLTAAAGQGSSVSVETTIRAGRATLKSE